MTTKSKNHYNVVLLSPPSRTINHYRPPLGLMYVGGYLQKKKLKVKIIDITLREIVRDRQFSQNIANKLVEVENDILTQISQIQTPIVGITCYTPEFKEVLRLAHKIKKICPKSKIIVGGIHPTLYPDELLLEPNSPIDFEVIGEGEETMLELSLAIIHHRRSFSTIRSIAYLDKKTNQVIKTTFRPIQDNLDLISYPAYNLVDMDYYTNASPYAIRGCFLRSTYVMATRGCPSQCTFCVAKKLRQFNGGGKYTRIRSAQSLVREIKLLRQKYHIDSFYFIDDLFTINKDNVVNFCRQLKKHNLDLLWGCSSKVSTLNEDIIREMATAGCVQIDFGVERGSNEALNLVKKGISVEMIINIFNLCHQYHIRTFANFLVNLPQEKTKDLNDIISLIDQLHPEIVSLNIFSPYPGTEIYDNAKYKFSQNEYTLLYSAADAINKQPKKFKFCSHHVDLVTWAESNHKKYNRVLPNLLFHLQPRYIKTILLSPDKLNYLAQSRNLLREFINQKFGT